LGIIAASIAVASGVILAMANTTARNLIQPYAKNKWSDIRLIVWARIISIPIMLAAVFFAYVKPEPGTLLILAFDIVLSGCFVPFALGIYWKKANATAAVFAILGGASFRILLFLYIPDTMTGLDTILAPVLAALLFWVTVSFYKKNTRVKQGTFTIQK